MKTFHHIICSFVLIRHRQAFDSYTKVASLGGATQIAVSTYHLYLRRLNFLGVPAPVLGTVYAIFNLPTLTHSSPVWYSSLTATQRDHFERMQKRACKTILQRSYIAYMEVPNIRVY